jgi:hypothetical protein
MPSTGVAHIEPAKKTDRKSNFRNTTVLASSLSRFAGSRGELFRAAARPAHNP